MKSISGSEKNLAKKMTFNSFLSAKKIILSIGYLGIALLLTDLYIFVNAFMIFLIHYSTFSSSTVNLILISEFFTFIVDALIIICGFLHIRFILFFIVIYSFRYLIPAIHNLYIEPLPTLSIFAAFNMQSLLFIFLNLLAYLGLFLWWNESKTKKSNFK